MTNKKRKIALQLLDNLSIAYDRFKEIQTTQLLDENLSITQFEALKVLLKTGPIPLNKISITTLVTGANITYVIDYLEKAGFVKRVFSKNDRRVIQAELTKKGKDKIESILPKYSKSLASLASCLSSSEQKEMVRLLDKLNL